MSQQETKVPVDLEALLASHGKFILYVVMQVIRHPLSKDDLLDMQQEVLLTLLHRQYLDRCRAYEAACAAAGKPYSFNASLRAFTERWAKNYLRNTQAKKRDARKVCSLSHFDAVPGPQTPEHAHKIPATLQVAPTQEAAAISASRFARIRAQLVAGRQIIGGVPAVQVLDTALQTDTLPHYYLRKRLSAIVEASA